MKSNVIVILTVLLLPLFAACATNGGQAATAASPDIVYSRALRMAELRLERFVTTPQQMRDRAWESFGATNPAWRSIELLRYRELPDGHVEFTLRWTQTNGLFQDQVQRIRGPRLITAWYMGPISGPTEALSAYDARRLIGRYRRLYREDPEYRRIVDLIEDRVTNRLAYDWEAFLGRFSRNREEALRLGVGVCSVYADLVHEVLAEAGFAVETWSSSIGNHAWNHVTMPDGRTLFIDATWYDNGHESHPTNPSPDGYAPWYITFDRALFEHGFNRTINMHGAWPDARRIR